MRQKFVFVTAIAVCLSLALVPAFASGRTVDRSGDRTKAAKGQGATAVVPEFEEQLRSIPANSRLSGDTSVANKATAMISAAAKQEGDTAIATLQQVITMDFESTDQTDRIRSSAHEMLAGLYPESTAKQVMQLSMALQYASDPARRAGIENRISELGGDVFSTAFTTNGLNSYTMRDPGADDSCVGAAAVALPHSEVMSITPAGDHNWRSFDVPGPDGALVRLETFTDGAAGSDDTDLTLWSECPPVNQVAFNDDKPGDFTSRIDTGCLIPGTYYVEVGGFFDISTPDNFTLEIEQTGSCEVPPLDGFEPDDSRDDDLADIGLPTDSPGNGWGRAKKEIQGRSMFPPGDIDHANVKLTKNELTRMGTRTTWPTFWNNFDTSPNGTNPDTILTLLYDNEPDYGGRCNNELNGFLPVCFSDAECPPCALPDCSPISGLPDCVPIQLFNVPVDFENPLAENDDRGGGDFGSELLMCLPRSQPQSDSLTMANNPGDYLVRVSPFSANDFFAYELNVKNEVGCLFEDEPNGTFASATPYEIGTIVSGFYDFVETNPYADDDLYSFDVAATADVAMQTFAPDSLQSDTFFELFVGPDDVGDFFFTGVSNDDGGSGFLSAIAVTLPPASALLGNTTADADYYLNVTSAFYNPNYYYDLASAFISASAASETEPNDTIGSANTINIGGTVIAMIDAGCDVDTYRFEVTEDTFITLGATAGGDSAINLVECGTEQQLSCDDDSGGSMLPSINGCLPAGQYCAQVRAFSAGDSFAYEVQLNGTGGCIPTSPPTMSGDNSFTCLDFASCP